MQRGRPCRGASARARARAPSASRRVGASRRHASRRHRAGICGADARSRHRVDRRRTDGSRLDCARARHQGVGARARVSRRSASPTPSSARAEARLADWLDAGCHGEMDYMARHGIDARAAGGAGARHAARHHARAWTTGRADARDARARCSPIRARRSSSRYALGRDYHKVLRARLQQLADRIAARSATFGYRVFTDCAPVMEVALARESRARLARQAHAAAHARAGSYVLPRRDLHRPAAAGRRAGQRALRHLHARASTSARPARSSRRTSSMRAAASPTSPSSSRAAIPESCGR